MNTERISRNIRRAAAVATLCLAGVVAAAPQAVSKSPHQVDPLTMTPALNPQFAPWSCFEAGTGITCQGSFEQSYHEPIGLFCDGQEVWIRGSGREFMTRWHNADGEAVKTQVHLDYPGDVFTLTEDGTGPWLMISAHWNRLYVYRVPGDLSQRVLREIGANWLARTSAGVVFRDVGTVTYAPGEDFETVTDLHGVHDVISGAVDVAQEICDALT